MSGRHLLVVDDDDRLRALLKEFLSGQGFRVTAAADAAAARRLLELMDFDLLVLDVMMPGEDGFAFARWLRGRAATPVLMLSARGMPDDRIEGLSAGVDDYLSKPFEPQELVLRIEAILRRAGAAPAKPDALRFGVFSFDPGRGELQREGAPVRLTEGEAALLKRLAQTPNAPVDRLDLPGGGDDGMGRAVDIQVTRLRRKLEDDPKNPRWLQTVRGRGYMLAPRMTPGWREALLRPRLWRPMGRRLAKRWLPRSLFARSVLIIVLPVLVMQAVVGAGFFEAHWRTVTRQLSESLAGDVAWTVSLYERDPSPPAYAALVERAERSQGLSVAFQPGRTLPTNRRGSWLAFDGALREAVDERVREPVWIDTTRYPAYVDVRVAVPGGVLRFLAPRERAFATRGHVFLLWLTGATLLLSAVAVAFIRNQVRAIERLAEAADAFGRGQEVAAFKPHGAREVRMAAEAFNAMRARIRRHIDQRTAMLASVSHDLRTPLTRLKLQAAMSAPSPRMEEIKRDIADMEAMIDEYLAFARGQAGEDVSEAAVGAILAEVGADARRTGAAVAVEAEPGLTAALRPKAFKRALANLVNNAAAHGEHVQVAARRTPFGGLEVCVDDDGPGIPPDRYEEAFRPFARLDEARCQNTKGVGLGLAIARDVARGHGGEVELAPSPLGGLRAVVRLPG